MTEIDRNVGEVDVFIASDATIVDTVMGYDTNMAEAGVIGAYLLMERELRLKMCEALQKGVDMSAEGAGSTDITLTYKERLTNLVQEFDWDQFLGLARSVDTYRWDSPG
jgi:hypothetical protein